LKEEQLKYSLDLPRLYLLRGLSTESNDKEFFGIICYFEQTIGTT